MPAPKKPTPKKPATKRKATSKKAPSTAKRSVDRILSDSVDEVEDYLVNLYQAEEDHFHEMPTTREVLFCDAYLSNGFKQAEAAKTAIPDIEPNNAGKIGTTYLKKDRVQRYLSNRLHERRLKMGVTLEFICKKYLFWAMLDPTEILSGDGRKSSAITAKDVKALHPLVRQSIKKIEFCPLTGNVKNLTFIDQKSSLDSLAKILGFAQNKVTIETDQPVVLQFDSQDSDA